MRGRLEDQCRKKGRIEIAKASPLMLLRHQYTHCPAMMHDGSAQNAVKRIIRGFRDVIEAGMIIGI